MNYPDVLGLLVVCLFMLGFYYLSLRYGVGEAPSRAPRRTFKMPPIPRPSFYEWQQWTTTTTYPTKTEGYLVVIAASADSAMKFAKRTDTPVDLGPPKDPPNTPPGHRRWGFGLNTATSATSEQDKETT